MSSLLNLILIFHLAFRFSNNLQMLHKTLIKLRLKI